MEVVAALLIYVSAALGEIAGCFSFWAWARLGRSPLWMGPGLVSLAIFAWLLTRTDVGFAGRAYAAYGGVYIGMSLLWLWAAEGVRPDRWDWIGAGLSVLGAGVVLFSRRIVVG